MEVVVAAVVSIFLFYLLAVVSEDFFVPSIDILTKKLKIPSDVAGATFLAIGSSAPEFFSSLIAVFGLAGAHADVGAGTIVGSAIFNVLVIIGASAMFKSVVLQWQPVVRDLGFYVITILLLFFFFQDGQISFTEASVFLGVYVVYIFATVNWRKWFPYKDIKAPEYGEMEGKDKKTGLTANFRKALSFIIPDTDKYPKLYGVTFVASIAVIAAASYVLVEQLTSAANILNINPTFLALTVLAAGTSIPDLMGSIIVARQGRGDMAVSNAIGSNIFDILFGLGFPWFLYIAINGGIIVVDNNNLIASILLLVATVIAIIFLLIVRNWKIGHRSGLILIFLYVAYCIYTVLQL